MKVLDLELLPLCKENQIHASFKTLSSKKGFTKNRKALIIIVENIGVEPMTSCMPCKRSSQLS